MSAGAKDSGRSVTKEPTRSQLQYLAFIMLVGVIFIAAGIFGVEGRIAVQEVILFVAGTVALVVGLVVTTEAIKHKMSVQTAS